MDVLPIDQVRSAVAEAIMQACLGVDDVRGKGIIIDLPEFVDVQCVVVMEWQSLEIRSESTGTNEDKRAAEEKSTRSESQEGATQDSGRTASGHDQTSTREYGYA